MVKSRDINVSPLADVGSERNAESRLARLRPDGRNALLPSPMSLLLPELLSIIFFIYAEDNTELFDLRWTRILLVCRHWYDVAVHSPELWSHIELRDIPPGTDVLEVDAQDIRRMNSQRSRAGCWPLTMNLTLFSTISEPKQTHLTTFWDPSTSFSLTIHGSNNFLQTIIHILEDRCHDILAHLVIGGPRGRGAPALILPNIILSDHTPRLRNLSVDDMLLSWASIKGLRSLRVVYKAWTRISFNLSEILDALVRCPLLEHLQIAFPGSFRPEAVALPSDLTLSRIKSIHLLGPDVACGHLLHALPTLHRTTKVSISAIDNSNRTGSSLLPSSFSYLSNHTSHTDAPVIRVIGLMIFLDSDHGRSKQFGLTGDVDLHLPITDCKWSDTGRPNANSYVGAIATPNKRSQINLLHHIIHQWPVAQVTHLDVRFPSAFVDQDLWRALFASLPTVTTVLVQSETLVMSTLFDVLEAHLQETGKLIVDNVVLDLSRPTRLRFVITGGPEAFAPYSMRRVLSYCANAAGVNVPLDTVEVVNDVEGYFGMVNCSDYCKNLARGFVYRGALYTATKGSEDT